MTINNLKKGLNALKPLYGKEIIIYNCNIQLIQINYMNVSANWNTKPHSHSWYELHFVNSGQAYTVLEGEKLEVNTGNYYIIPPDTSHTHQQSKINSGHQGFALRWQLLTECNQGPQNNISLSELESGLQDKKIRQGKNLEYNIQHLINMKIKYGAQTLPLLATMGSLIFSLSKNDELYNQSGVSNLNCSLSFQAKLFLEDNFEKKIKMEKLADILSVSYPHLARVFKKDMGKSLVTYLQEIRVKEIKKLLGNTGLTLKEIAAETGFKNEYYLSRVFKKNVGLAPSKFRNRLANM